MNAIKNYNFHYMMLDKSKEAALMRDIVSPHLCKQMIEIGVTAKTIYTWRLFPDGWRLWTYAFDPSNLYKDTDRAVYMVYPDAKPKEIIPAYTTGDMAKVIPGFLLSATTDDFEISLDHIYGNVCVREKRIPDAMARSVIEILRLPGYTPEYISEKILSI